jgi:dihydroneopterin aldolase
MNLDLVFLQSHRRLFLRNIEVFMNIGAHEFEKNAPQRVIINVDLYVPMALSTPSHDQLNEVVDYDFVRRIIATKIGQEHIQLQETLCDALAAEFLAHPEVVLVRVSTEKPDVYPDCEAVGVEVIQSKPKAV